MEQRDHNCVSLKVETQVKLAFIDNLYLPDKFWPPLIWVRKAARDSNLSWLSSLGALNRQIFSSSSSTTRSSSVARVLKEKEEEE